MMAAKNTQEKKYIISFYTSRVTLLVAISEKCIYTHTQKYVNISTYPANLSSSLSGVEFR